MAHGGALRNSREASGASEGACVHFLWPPHPRAPNLHPRVSPYHSAAQGSLWAKTKAWAGVLFSGLAGQNPLLTSSGFQRLPGLLAFGHSGLTSASVLTSALSPIPHIPLSTTLRTRPIPTIQNNVPTQQPQCNCTCKVPSAPEINIPTGPGS